MATILISTMPATGHVNPAVPLATELARRGHEVIWHTGAAYRDRVVATGARFTPLVHTPDFDQIPLTPDVGAKGMAAGVSIMRRLFVDRMAGQVADYQEILREHPVDVVIADMCTLGAQALHDLGGPVWATLGINPLTTLDPEIPMFGSGKPPATGPGGRLFNRLTHVMTRRLFMPPVTRLINAERAELGLADLPPKVQLTDVQRSPYLHLMPTTMAFEYPRAKMERQIRFVGPLLPAPPTDFTPPAWWPELADNRVVHVTQGTYATDADALIRPTVAALADRDVLVVVTTPDPASLGALPANVRVAPFVPHSELLPHVDAMVTNAGYNGVLTALAHGVPLVCAGRTEDKAEVSARVAWSGAGLDLRTNTPTAEQVRAGVHTVLTEESYRRNARRIRDDFAGHRPAVEAADEVRRLVGVPSTHRFAATATAAATAAGAAGTRAGTSR